MNTINNAYFRTNTCLQFRANKKEKEKQKSTNTSASKNYSKRNGLHIKPHLIHNAQVKAQKDFSDFLNKKGKVSLEEYKKIAKYQPSIISKCYSLCSENKTLGISPKTCAIMAISLKDYYDKKYGNYKIVSIGTSPAVITEVMQNLGADVLFLPISHLHQLGDTKLHPMRAKYPTIASRYRNIQIIMDYCTKKGISKDNSKKIILLDFASQGKTLNKMREILNERGDIPQEKICTHSIIEDLKEIIASEDTMTKWEMVRHLQNDMARSCVSDVCNVAHFPCNDDDEMYKDTKNTIHSKNRFSFQVFNDFENFSTPNGRAWALCATHEAMKLIE